MLGYYGTTAAGKDEAVLQKAELHAKKPPITCRPADLLKPEWEELRLTASKLEGFNGSDEDVLTAAMFPQVAPKFFPARKNGPKNLGKDPKTTADAAKVGSPGKPAGNAAPQVAPLDGPVTYGVTVNGRTHKVTVNPG
jgi:methylmalonyl-CoA carboxyltransferase 5S subunit